ncbi:hypothetical protein Tco_1409373 [Tanacetum coccineum]
MNPIATQQAALDNALVPYEKRLKIERCNARIAFSKPQKEETYQVTLEALKLSPCYPAFVITAEVLEIYMHQFWTTIKKIRDSDAYNFKLEKKKFRVDTEVFLKILQIYPKILNQDFIAPPSEEDLVTFIHELGQIKKRAHALPKIHKVIINHFISKDKTISMRNMINLHTIRNDSLLGTLKFVSKTQDYRQYEALILDDMINQDIKDSSAYQTYYDFASGKVPLRKAMKYKKVASPSRKLSPVKEAEPVKKAKRVKRPANKSTNVPTVGVAIRDTPGVSVSKKKAHAKSDKSKGIEILSGVALSEAAQLKEATKRSKEDFHISQASDSGDGTDFESGVPDDQQRKTSGTDEGTGTKPRVLDVPTYNFKSENESWGNSKEDNDDDSKGNDDKADSDNDANSDADANSERTDSDDDENPSFTLKDYDEEEHDEEYESDDDYENMFEEEDDDDLYKDVDMRSLGTESEKERKGNEEMTDADQNKTESSKQSSSVSSEFASKFLILENVPPTVDEVASMMNFKSRQEEPSTQAPSLFTVPETAIPETATIHASTVPPTISMITPLPQLTTPTPTPTTASTTTSIPTLLDSSSLFDLDQSVSTMETEFTRIGYATRTALESYIKEFEKKDQEERKLYIDVVEKLVKDIIKDEVKSLLSQILFDLK